MKESVTHSLISSMFWQTRKEHVSVDSIYQGSSEWKKSFKTPLMFTARILANSVEDDSISKKLVYLSMCYLLYPL